MASENIENYLKNIYKIQEEEGRVTTTTLSHRLQISPPSVSEMVRRLAEEGHVRHTPYKGVELTASGRKRALRIIRRHRLWEVFLVEVLKYNWEEIDAEAERLEHSMSELLESRLDEALGFPTHDPHGHAIPTAEGHIDPDEHRSLAEVAEGRTVVVRRVSDADPRVLKYASRLGVSLGARLRVRERYPFDGTLLVSIGRKEQSISASLARQISVDEVRK